jgi:pyruvate/2-oxoglutarate dehydrogenase complex dihydrolipoamide dehydrogenase (E3) component
VEGLESVAFLDNASIMELDTVPEHLLVLGGGYIGVEFGQLFRRFGSHVTILHTRDRLLTREDRDVTQELEKILRLTEAFNLKSTSKGRPKLFPDRTCLSQRAERRIRML